MENNDDLAAEHRNMLSSNNSRTEPSTDNTTISFSDKNENINIIDSALAFYLKGFELFPIDVLKIIFGTIFSSGVITNIMLVAYLAYFRHYKKPVFCALMCLGIADFGVSLSALVTHVVVFPINIGPHWFCNAFVFLTYISYPPGNYQVSVFAILRFCQLIYPLQSRSKVTSALMIRVVLAIFLFCLIPGIAMTFYWDPVQITIQDNREAYICWFVGNTHITDVWIGIVNLMVPCLLTAVFHVAKYIVMLVQKSSGVTDDTIPHERKTNRQTDSRILVIIISVYFITVLPLCVLLVRRSVINVAFTHREWLVWYIFNQIAMVNSSINPWIYLFGAESVRLDIQGLFARNRKIR